MMLRLLVSLTFLALVRNVLSVNVCEVINPCLNDGKCTPTGKTDDYVCVCPPDFTGIVCQSRLMITSSPNQTTHAPVSIKRKPQNPHDKHICNMIKPCLNNGTCTPNGKHNDYICVCPPLYVGRVCQKRLVSTTASTKTTTESTKSTSTITTTSSTSTTTEQLTHLLTEPATTTIVEIDGVKISGQNHICNVINPCLNNGTCSPTDDDDYICLCPPSFTGIVCQSLISVHDLEATAYLTTKSTTDTTTDSSIETTEETTEVTIEETTEVTIEATNELTTMENIDLQEIIILEKKKFKAGPDHICNKISPCLNDGICTPIDSNNYVCICPPKYTGIVCQSILTLEINDFAVHNETDILSLINNLNVITKKIATTKKVQKTPQRGTSTFNYKSVGCEFANCNNGLCLPKPTGHMCICLDGWEGESCDIKSSEVCKPACENDGICIKGKCTCSPLFSGGNCSKMNEANVSRCSSNICHNGGTCYNISDNQVRCVCRSENYGDYCEEVN